MIIVIGATGFIGTYLIDQLVKDGVDVLACGRSKAGEEYYKSKGVPFMRLDVTKEDDFNKLPKKNVNAVVHLACLIPAASKEDNATAYLKTNTIGTVNALEYCRKYNIKKFVLTSSHFAVEGLWNDKQIPISEEMGLKFKYTGGHAKYIISRVAAEEYVRCYMEEYGMQCFVLRVSGVRGVGRYESGFELFINKAKKSETIEIWGDNSKVWDNIYVKDVVRGIILALKNDISKGFYNLSSGIPMHLKDEVESIVKVFSDKNNPSNIVLTPKKEGGIQKSYVYDITKIKNDLGFTPQYSCLDMVKDIKKDMESRRFNFLIESRRKEKKDNIIDL